VRLSGAQRGLESVGIVLSQAAGCRILLRQIQQPNIGAAPVCLHVRFTQHEGGVVTVGRNLRIRNSLHTNQVFGSKRSQLRGRGVRGGRNRCRRSRASGKDMRGYYACHQQGCQSPGNAHQTKPTSYPGTVHVSLLAASNQVCIAGSSRAAAMYQRAVSVSGAP